MSSIAIEGPAQPDVAALLRAGDKCVAWLYPAEGNHRLDLHSLQRREVIFIVARARGRACGRAAPVG